MERIKNEAIDDDSRIEENDQVNKFKVSRATYYAQPSDYSFTLCDGGLLV
ncbi:hypothetical protein EYZ11_000384 [Aspergillus tanneri]|uniref:Uncharacterized protein n=1 Tax=Aspergillus tanneri TaxID=1220188 RepID=A0A4S3JXE5_9EURO|nr:hypothetical protein EYZ11_000384 [Aspergillus tanneri]